MSRDAAEIRPEGVVFLTSCLIWKAALGCRYPSLTCDAPSPPLFFAQNHFSFSSSILPHGDIILFGGRRLNDSISAQRSVALLHSFNSFICFHRLCAFMMTTLRYPAHSDTFLWMLRTRIWTRYINRVPDTHLFTTFASYWKVGQRLIIRLRLHSDNSTS